MSNQQRDPQTERRFFVVSPDGSLYSDRAHHNEWRARIEAREASSRRFIIYRVIEYELRPVTREDNHA